MSDELKPDCVNDTMLKYLDNLRESGVANMFSDIPCIELQHEFLLSRDDARKTLLYWMNTFKKRHAA